MALIYYNIHTHAHRGGDSVAIVNIAYGDVTPRMLDTTPHLSLSLHPWEVANTPTIPHEEMLQLATHPHVVAIGECGLDGAVVPPPLALQEELFATQIRLSEEIEKPLIIHCVRAYDRLLYLHKKIQPKQAWIVHGYRGKPQLATQLQERGIYLSIGERYNADTLVHLDTSLTLLESDTSTLPIQSIYQEVASARGIDTLQLATQIAHNVERLFGNALTAK